MSFLMSPELEGIVDITDIAESDRGSFFSFSEEEILSLKVCADPGHKTIILLTILGKSQAKNLIESGDFSEIKISNSFFSVGLKIKSIEVLHQDLQEYHLRIICNIVRKEKSHE